MFDAVRVRLIEIGEAVKAIDPALLAHEPDVPWIDVAAMRNHLAHRYFDTAHAIVQSTVDHDLPPLVAAVRRLLSAPAESSPERLTEEAFIQDLTQEIRKNGDTRHLEADGEQQTTC